MDTCPQSRESFVDLEKCLGLIEEVQTKLGDTSCNESQDRIESEKLIEAFRKTIDAYQEQPELLDPHLAVLIEKLTSGLDIKSSSNKYHTVFKFLYQLIKVTGFKSIGKKFPHETDKLALLVDLLIKENPQDKINWHARYVLTVWLSIVILTPFDLAKFDPSPSNESLSDKIYSVLIRSLNLHDSCQHVTAFCIAKFFSRPDVLRSEKYVDKFIKTALVELENIKPGIAGSMDDVQLIGYLKTMCYMFKYLPRAEMKLRSHEILGTITKLDIDVINRELVNHLIIKLTQRAGLALLPKPTATWRYKRGSRILGHLALNDEKNVALKPASEQVVSGIPEPRDSEEELTAINHFEAILSNLFVAAQNAQTKIRWSAAKGIARLANRMSRERAGDVIDMVVVNFFDATSTEFAWHGGTLTLAEMSRQGLILEEKLPDIVRIISKAILYDKIKGSFAVGSHVREAACYVCWAMARTYEDSLLEPYIPSISVSLLCTMLFDRELQCRRAASATFQELVGRQGTYNEEGISILTNVDYQSVGQRPVTYLHLASQIASYGDKYSRPFVDHLLEKKIGHWDVQIRRLACDSLSGLMLHTSHDYIESKVLKQLIELSGQDSDNNAKHGGLLGLAKVISGLVPLQYQFKQELVDFVGSVVKRCEKQLKSKQQASNFMEAIGHIISSAEVAGFKYSDDSDIVKQWESIAFSALDSDNSSLREIGSNALLTLYKTYYKCNKTQQDRILTILNKSLISPNESSRCGGLKSLSKLSQVSSDAGVKTDADTPDIVFMSLTSYIGKPTHEKSLDIVFAQAKAEACEALVEFVRHLDKSRLVVSSSMLDVAYEALLEKTQDYTFDKRGDIGVVVRRAAIKAILELTLHLLSIGMTSLFNEDRVTRIIAKTLQQAVSYNNSARELAATSFYRLIGSDLPENTIAHRGEILSLFDKYGVDDQFNWRDDSTPIFVNLLAKPEYSSDLWLGLLPSVGQVSDICAKQFRDALSDYIISLSNSPLNYKQVFECFLSTLECQKLADRLVTSGLIVADFLLTQGLMNDTESQYQERLVKFFWQSREGADMKRLLSVARVLSSMLQFSGKVQRDCIEYCLALLINGYAKVRVYTAEQLYLSIMTYQADLEANDCLDFQGEGVKAGVSEGGIKMDLEGAMELLSQTNWAEPLEKVKPIRDQICTSLLPK